MNSSNENINLFTFEQQLRNHETFEKEYGLFQGEIAAGLVYIDGVIFNPSALTYIESDTGLNRLHFVGGGFVDVDKNIIPLLARINLAKRSRSENQIQKEKIEETEKRDIPPIPPIESKGKEEEKKDSLSSRAREKFCSEFWDKYPSGHKVAKKKCFKKLRSRFDAAIDKDAFTKLVMDGLDRWIKSSRWMEGVICNPETFINQERWNDECPNDTQVTKGGSNGRSREIVRTANANVSLKDARRLF